MSTNPNNGIGTNGALYGRTSVNAFNDDLALYTGRGALSGFAVSPNAGMSVAIGGDGTTRDVAVVEDNIGNRTTINNRLGTPIVLTIAGAPANNSRIDAIVAYVDNPAQGIATETDNPSACGLIDVQGTVSATPSRPTDANIRSAITADGSSGATAYYVVLAYIIIASGTTDITSNMITQGPRGRIEGAKILDKSILPEKINDYFSTNEQVVGTWINGKPLYRKVVPFGALPNNATKEISLNGTGAQYIRIVKIDAYMTTNGPMSTYARAIPCWTDTTQRITCYWSEYVYQIGCNYDASSFNANIIEYYWKTTD